MILKSPLSASISKVTSIRGDASRGRGEVLEIDRAGLLTGIGADFTVDLYCEGRRGLP